MVSMDIDRTMAQAAGQEGKTNCLSLFKDGEKEWNPFPVPSPNPSPNSNTNKGGGVVTYMSRVEAFAIRIKLNQALFES